MLFSCRSTNCSRIVQRESFDEELAAVPPEEREAYLKEFEDADRTGESKKGGLIDKRKFSRCTTYIEQ